MSPVLPSHHNDLSSAPGSTHDDEKTRQGDIHETKAHHGQPSVIPPGNAANRNREYSVTLLEGL